MRLKCYCGKGLHLSQKEAKLILPKQEMFCSTECFHQYLIDLRPQTKEMPYMLSDGMVGEEKPNYDRVTKQKYRSLYEVYCARFLFYNDFPFYYERYTVSVGKKYYTPDFFLPEVNTFIEVKGLWSQGSKQKFLAAREKIDLILLPSYLQKAFTKKYKDV